MSTAGLQVFNDSGSIQVDITYRNLCLRQKGTLTTTAYLPAGASAGCSYGSFNVTGLTTPIIAVGGSVTACPQTYYDSANSRHGFLISAVGAIGTNVPYYIFDVPTELGSTSGFVVRDSSGVLVFDALQPALRVRGFYPSTSSNVSNLASGRTYAIAHPTLGFRTVTVEVYSRLYGTVPATNGFNINYIDYSTLATSPTQTLIRLPTLLAIDVTGL